MKVWLDDNHTGYRFPPDGSWVHVHNKAELERLLDECADEIAVMSFDNDLGPAPEPTGYDIIKWFAGERLSRYPKEVRIHSANIVDAENIWYFDRNVRKHLLGTDAGT